MPKVLIGLPTMDSVKTDFFVSFIGLQTFPGVKVAVEANSLTHFARNKLAYRALKDDFDYLVMIDSDMTFQPDSIVQLVRDAEENNLDYVGALAFKRKLPTIPVVIKELVYEVDEETAEITATSKEWRDYPKNTLFECAGTGFGMVLIRCSALEKVVETSRSAPFDPMAAFGEDYTFCWKMAKAGLKMWCDSRVKCGHVGTMIYDEEVWLGQES